MNQGKIIVFEGLPNSGKSEMIKRLKSDFPDFVYYSELATELFKKDGVISAEKTTNEIAEIFWKNELKRAKEAYEYKSKDKVVIMDRNLMGCLVHTYSNNQSDMFEHEKTQYFSGFIPYPDCYIYLKISPETSVARRGHRQFEHRGSIDQLKLMEKAYNSIFSSHPQPTSIIEISAERPLEEVYSEVKNSLRNLL